MNRLIRPLMHERPKQILNKKHESMFRVSSCAPGKSLHLYAHFWIELLKNLTQWLENWNHNVDISEYFLQYIFFREMVWLKGTKGIRYHCDQCDFAATIPGNLETPKESKHEGIRYPCNQYAYAATDQTILNDTRNLSI